MGVLSAFKSTWLEGNHATPTYSEERSLGRMTVRATDPELEDRLQAVNALYTKIAYMHYDIDALNAFAGEQPSAEIVEYIQLQVQTKQAAMQTLLPEYQTALDKCNYAVYLKHVLYADKQQEILNERAAREHVVRSKLPRALRSLLHRASAIKAAQALR